MFFRHMPCWNYCKYSASRAQYKINLFIFIAEAQPILSKYSASREENKISLLIFYPEAQPILSKYGASHFLWQNKSVYFANCAACLIQSYLKRLFKQVLINFGTTMKVSQR